MSEYRPTEYVVDFGDYRSNQFVRLNMALIEQNGSRLHERIVRCRDCANLNIVDKCPCGFWALENLNGFCAWGKRKEGGDD